MYSQASGKESYTSERWMAKLLVDIGKCLTSLCRHSCYCAADGGVPLLLGYSEFLRDSKWNISFLAWLEILTVMTWVMIRYEFVYPIVLRRRLC